MSGRPLDREEYIEQAYCFRTFRERLDDNTPAQEILRSLSEELLATTNLPKAIDFLRGEILHAGRISPGMARLAHYFTPFQTLRHVAGRGGAVAIRPEDGPLGLGAAGRIPGRIADSGGALHLSIRVHCPQPARLRPRDEGDFRRSRSSTRRGGTGFSRPGCGWGRPISASSSITARSNISPSGGNGTPTTSRRIPILFSVQEGRIAKANRGKDPLYMFAALQRQIGHPAAPRRRAKETGPIIHPALEQRLQRIETRLKILDSEVKGEFNLSDFYVKPETFSGPEEQPAG